MQLKEKNELDYLLCDLLLQEGYHIDSIPKTGNRQFGVDIQAQSKTDIMLFVVKQGNINRENWDSEPNAVRQSINEIFDVYLSMLPSTAWEKKINIIVTTNGIIEENTKYNWNGYINSHNQYKGHILQIDFWGIDKLTEQVQQYLFNEYLLPKEIQSSLRKALYFVEEQDYKHRFFEQVIDYYINKMTSMLDSDAQRAKKLQNTKKEISSLFLASQMIVQYAYAHDRYKIGININEYLLIRYWQFLFKNHLLGKEQYTGWLIRICNEYKKANLLYYEAIQDFCERQDLFPRYGDIIEQRIMLYEIIGYLSSYAYYALYFEGRKSVEDIVNTIILLINLHPEFQYIPFDSNICQLSILFRLLCGLDRKEEVKSIINNECFILQSYYRLLKKYPTSADSYLDALNIEKGNEHEEYETSGLWGYLLLWIYLLDDEKTYKQMQEFLSKDLEKVTKCAWFMRPNEETLFYEKNAMNMTGDGVAIQIKEKYQDFRKQIDCVFTQYKNDCFSFEEYSFSPLELIICRYYGYIPRVKDI